MKKRNIELLAPAGGPKQFYAAVKAGADACYMGGPQFNARINAENFILEELEECVDYGHLRGVKTYVTMNTLVTDEELPKAVEYAKKLYAIGVDALIIQDLGLGLAIHEAMPDFELHLSTQATVFNQEGVAAAKELGYKRVVLARELSIAEIKKCCSGEGSSFKNMRADEWPEIEVFVHGAMCYCYSGQCQLSRFIGLQAESAKTRDEDTGKKNPTRSGNRGTCAQPCRLAYTYIHSDGMKDDNPYPLSPKDLCMIDNLGELIEAGVTSFKIEGRMKSPEYVSTVTRIYRKYINMYLAKGSYQVSAEDRLELAQIFNRGGFTEGYAHEDLGESFMSKNSPKNQGVEIGEVESTKGLFATVNLTGPLEMHDVVEIRSTADLCIRSALPSATSFMVTYLDKIGPHKAKIGDLKDDVKPGDKVFRLVSDSLNSKAMDLPERKSSIELTFTAKLGQEMKLTANAKGIKDQNGKGISVSVVLEGIYINEANSNPATEADVEEKLRRTGDTPFEVGRIRFIMDDGVFIPASKLNELRRLTLEALEKAIIGATKRELSECIENYELTTAGNASAINPIDVGPLLADGSNNMILLPNITKGDYDTQLERIATAAKKAGATVICNNISQIYLLSKEGVETVGGWGLNIFNKKSIEAYRILGMNEKYVPSAETFTRDEFSGGQSSAAGSPDAADDAIPYPLMITEHLMEPGHLIDRKGARYIVEPNEKLHKTYIFSE